MKITVDTPDRLEIQGIPHAGFALLGGVVVCPVLTAGLLFFIRMESQAKAAGSWTPTTLVFGTTLVFVLATWCVCGALALRRRRLTLDRVTRTGTDSTVWVWGPGGGRTATFSFDRVRAVSLERYSASSGGRSMPTEEIRARIMLDKPRRAVVIEDSGSGFRKGVEATAQRVAAWLAVPLRRDDDPGDRPRRRRPRGR